MISDFTSEIWPEGPETPPQRIRNPAPPPARRAGDGRGMGETHDAQRTTPRTATPSDGGPRAQSGGEAAAPGPPEPERRADNRRGGAKPGAAQHDRRRPAHRESRDRDRPARAAPADARRAARPGRRAARKGKASDKGSAAGHGPTTTEGRDRRGHSGAAPPPAAGRAQTPGRPPEEARHLHHRRAISARDEAPPGGEAQRGGPQADEAP